MHVNMLKNHYTLGCFIIIKAWPLFDKNLHTKEFTQSLTSQKAVV